MSRPRFTVSFPYELASSTSNSWTPTADELQYLIDHLREQAQLNENYAREERCLAAVLDATRANHDINSLPLPPANISPLPFLFTNPVVLDAHGWLRLKPRWNTRIGILDGNRL